MAEKSSFHSLLVKILSLSLVMAMGGPWSFTILSMNISATLDTVYGWDNATKWAYFVNLSTITRMTSLPFDLGSPRQNPC